jgi:Rod binding domain-containing protein
MPNAVGAVGAGFSAGPEIRDARGAAQAFEAMLLKQLMSTMVKSMGEGGFSGGGFESGLYADMFASSIAEEAAAGGTGLGEIIGASLGVEDRGSGSATTHAAATHLAATRGLGAYRATLTGAGEPPANTGIDAVAQSWLAGEAASRWGVDGTLTPADLGAQLATPGAGGVAAFNVQDAEGYRGYPKCNLFAFELVRRAGYKVPVLARSHGWGYVGADKTAKLAAEGDVGSWASVRTGLGAEELDRVARQGRPLLLASAAEGDAMGHMAVADRVHEVKRNERGEIAAIEYSGWDAATEGARYGRRMWRLKGVPGVGRGGLSSIQVLEPKPAYGGAQYVSLGGRPGASVHDGAAATAISAQGSTDGPDN